MYTRSVISILTFQNFHPLQFSLCHSEVGNLDGGHIAGGELTLDSHTPNQYGKESSEGGKRCKAAS